MVVSCIVNTVSCGYIMLVNTVIPEPGKSLVEAYDTWREIADSRACCDFAFHVCVTSWTDKVADEMDILTKDKGKHTGHFDHWFSICSTTSNNNKKTDIYIPPLTGKPEQKRSTTEAAYRIAYKSL